MTTNEGSDSQAALEIQRLARSVRFALVALVLCFCYLNLRLSLSISGFKRIFSDMLAGNPLPPLTMFVLAVRPALVTLSVLLPMATLATLLDRTVTRSFYCIGGIALVTLMLFILLCHGLSTPLLQLLDNLGSPPVM